MTERQEATLPSAATCAAAPAPAAFDPPAAAAAAPPAPSPAAREACCSSNSLSVCSERTLLKRRKLNLKANVESALPHSSFKL